MGVPPPGLGLGTGIDPPPLVLSPVWSMTGKMCGGQNDLLMMRLSEISRVLS